MFTKNSIFSEISPILDRPWRPQPWLGFLSPVYWAAAGIHRAWMVASEKRCLRAQPFLPTIPMVVVGALKVGGSGKTSVTLEIARAFSQKGYRVAVLAYRIKADPRKVVCAVGDSDLMEVEEGDDWRSSSEEALLLRCYSGARVFVTRNRARAWRSLHRTEWDLRAVDPNDTRPFDLIVSDDGLQDPRLNQAFRLLLMAPGEKPALHDLLPAGPYRETWGAHARADLILEGPYPWDVTYTQPLDLQPPQAQFPAPEFREGQVVHKFWRRLILPPETDLRRPWIALCSLGDNRPFLADLRREGIELVAIVEGRNHAALPLLDLKDCVARFPEAGILCTRKDFLKLDPESAIGLPIHVVDQSICLDQAVLAAVEAHLRC